jgi:hyaluronate lyase
MNNNFDDYDVLRCKWKEMLTGGTTYDPGDPAIANQIAVITNTAESNRASLDKEAGRRTCLWSDPASTTNSSHVTSNYRRLKEMALAYATKGSAN